MPFLSRLSRIWSSASRLPPYCLLACVLASNTMIARAAEWYVEPSMDSSWTYDDNRTLETNDSEKSDSTLRVTPTIVFGRAAPAFDIRGSAALRVNRSSDGEINDENLDDTNQFFRLLSNYRTDRHRWRLNASLTRDTTLRDSIDNRASDAVAEPEAGDVADPNIGQDRIRVRRNRVRINPSWDWRVTERTDLDLAYNFDRLNYGNAKGTTLTDQTSHRGTATLSYQLSQADTVRGIATVRRFETDDSESQFDTYTAGLGYRHESSETFFAEFDGGLTHLNVRDGDSNDPESNISTRSSGERIGNAASKKSARRKVEWDLSAQVELFAGSSCISPKPDRRQRHQHER